MAKKYTSDNSIERDANKRTLPPFDLKVFERRLLEGCVYHVRRSKNAERFKGSVTERRRTLVNLMNAIEQLKKRATLAEKAIGDDVVNFEILGIDGVKKLESAAKAAYDKLKNGRVGRPEMPGDLALLIYCHLKQAESNRNLTDAIGEVIRAGGPIHKRIDAQFGSGSFDQLYLPSVRYGDPIWERTCKKPMKESGFMYFKQKLGMHLSPARQLQKFEQLIKRCGITEYEIARDKHNEMETHRERSEVD